MNRFAGVLVLVVLLVGVGLSASGSATPQPGSTAATLEVGTSSECAYHSIAAAIAAAAPGDTIKVQNTLFVESPLVISRDLTLAGGYNSAHPYSCLTLTGLNHTTVHRSGATAAPILRIQGAEVTITWFIFEDNAWGGGLEVSEARLEMANSIVRDNDYSGLYIHNRSGVTLTDVEISGNSADVGGGLLIERLSQVVADNTLIRNNSGWDYGAGVCVSGDSHFTARHGTRIEHNRTFMGCYEGGGVYATGMDTDVLIDASTVISNTAIAKGGGLFVAGGAEATIQNYSWIQENIAYLSSPPGGGGGVYVQGGDSALNVDHSFFYSNWADPEGGGIFNESGALDLNGAYLLVNNAAQRGGGIYTSLGPTTVRESVFYANVATYDSGGAIATHGAALSAERSYFLANTSDLEGSAIYVEGANLPVEPVSLIVNCYLVDNPTTAQGVQGPPASGSTLYVEGAPVRIFHNTLAHGSQQASFGVYVGEGSILTLVNNIISGFYTGIRRPSGGTGTATSDHDLFWNNTVHWDSYGITVIDPVLADPAFVGGGNYHLSAASAAINAGLNAGVLVDYDGDFRPWAGGFDIGADEYPNRVRIYLPFIRRG